LAKPFYEATKGEEWEPMRWEKEQEKAFKDMKRALINVPVVCLPGVLKQFFYMYMSVYSFGS
jgi:hypothetical protein